MIFSRKHVEYFALADKMILASSDAETDRMDEMEQLPSDLERLAKRSSENSENSGEDADEASDRDVKRAKLDNGDKPQQALVKEHDAKEDSGEADEDAEADAEAEERERVRAMNSLKDIEIKFAQLKDKLYDTQLQKLEFELKLCEENQHYELLEYLKMVDEDFQKKQQRLLNEQKYKLKTLDNQTRATRTQIHQQFMKECQDLKQKEILEITTDWYDINRERRQMDLMSIGLPEYYQYFAYLQSTNLPHFLPRLIQLRNGQLREISELQGLIKYDKGIPSGLEYLNGLPEIEIESDLSAIQQLQQQ